MDDSFAGSGYHRWLDEEEAGREREEQRVYPQEDLAAAQPETAAQVSRATDINCQHVRI